MTPSELTIWRKRLGLTKRGAAEALGVGVNYVGQLEAGKTPIPRYIEYACLWLATRFE